MGLYRSYPGFNAKKSATGPSFSRTSGEPQRFPGLVDSESKGHPVAAGQRAGEGAISEWWEQQIALLVAYDICLCYYYSDLYNKIPSVWHSYYGKLLWKMAYWCILIDDLPSKAWWFSIVHSYVRLPEGTTRFIGMAQMLRRLYRRWNSSRPYLSFLRFHKSLLDHEIGWDFRGFQSYFIRDIADHLQDRIRRKILRKTTCVLEYAKGPWHWPCEHLAGPAVLAWHAFKAVEDWT